MTLVKLLTAQGGDRFSHPPGAIVDVPADEARRMCEDKAAEPAPKGAKATHFREPSYAEQPEVFKGPVVPRRSTAKSRSALDLQSESRHGRPNQRPQPIRTANPVTVQAASVLDADDRGAEAEDED